MWDVRPVFPNINSPFACVELRAAMRIDECLGSVSLQILRERLAHRNPVTDLLVVGSSVCNDLCLFRAQCKGQPVLQGGVSIGGSRKAYAEQPTSVSNQN